ncbi:MAG: type II secretion system major pseudopilin GspG [Albidovulum sp.]|uniref:type II secretion system major pseudopilin GspG n=1 Tax=Albidovulum sp. TaxID=1872424 RepID=UPI003CAE7A86
MTNSRHETLSRQAGVTILEILIVLTIIAMVAAVVGPRLIGYLGKAKSETASLQIKQISDAVELFYIDMARYPSNAEGLAVLMSGPAGEAAWDGPYLTSGDGLTDPWGRQYLYKEPTDGGTFSVLSLGRDGKDGGAGEDADLTR